MRMSIKKALLLIAVPALLVSCGDFGDINENPNLTAKPETKYLFLGAEQYADYFCWNNNYNPWTQLYPQYISERANVQFTKFSIKTNACGIIYRHPIQNLDRIIQMNTDEKQKSDASVFLFGSSNNQIAMAKTLKAFFYMHVTDVWGMTPYFEAERAQNESLFKPKYDTQADIYADLDKQLQEAYAQFDNGYIDGEYEVIFGGDMSKWKKLNASIRMMLAIKLADIDPNNGKARFAKAYADGGIVDNADNMVRPYLNENASANPLYINIVKDGRKDFAPSNTLIDQLLALKDPRVAAYATSNREGKFAGWPFGHTSEEVRELKQLPLSEFPERYWKQNAPVTVISAAYILSLQAEAALRGWIGADYKALYAEAIQKSFEDNGIFTVGLLEKVESETRAVLEPNCNVATYVAQPEVALTGDVTTDMEKIFLQRWLGNYMQDGTQAWCDWRRSNIPNIKPGKVSPGLKVLPERMMYMPDDYEANRKNYDEAIKLQGENAITTRVWWDVKANN